MEAEIRELLATIQEPHLRDRCSSGCSARTRELWAGYRVAPAAKYYHQAYPHGLLEHCLGVAQAVSAISATFAGIDRDVAVTGALLHDIGKLEAYTEDPQNIDLTDAGSLHGEIAARLLPRSGARSRRSRAFPPSWPRRCCHIILSHHGTLEHGSPVVPCTREATLVHMIDNLGGRLGSFDRLERSSRRAGGGRNSTARSAAARSSRSAARRKQRTAGGRRARAKQPERPQIAGAPGLVAHPSGRRLLSCEADGKGHREADPPAVADLLPDGGAPAGHGARDPARRRGLQRHERGRLRAALLRRPLGARIAAHPADGGAVPRTGRPSRRTTRCARRTSTCRRSSSPTRSSRRCRPRSACWTASSPTPSRCAWRCSRSRGGARARCAAPEQRSVALGITASAGGHELSARLAKVETAIFRNKTIVFDYYTMERDEVSSRRVDPYHLLFQGGQFYLLGYAHEREAIRVFRLSRIRGKVAYATKAEHDFHRPADFDPRAYANARGLAARRAARRRGGAHLRADRLADRTPLRALRGDPRGGRGGLRAGGRRRGGGRPRLRHRLLEPARDRLVGPRPRRARTSARPRGAVRASYERRLELLEERHGETPPAARRALPRARRAARVLCRRPAPRRRHARAQRAAAARGARRATAPRLAPRPRSGPSASRGW